MIEREKKDLVLLQIDNDLGSKDGALADHIEIFFQMTSKELFILHLRCYDVKLKPEMEDENGHFTPTMFVKVHKQGCAIARKINLKAHDNYESLRRALEEMSRNFLSSQVFINTARRLYIVKNPEAAVTGKVVVEEELLISSSQVMFGGCFMYNGGESSSS
ncbi:unnamed protein product [Musa banksii]